MQLSPCPKPGESGTGKRQGRDWEPEVCAQAEVALEDLPGALFSQSWSASWQVMRRCMKLSSRSLDEGGVREEEEQTRDI